jgi:chaperonin GroES
VGNGKLLDSGERTAVDVKPGDRILFGKYSGADIKVDGDEYMILREEEILGVLE